MAPDSINQVARLPLTTAGVLGCKGAAGSQMGL